MSYIQLLLLEIDPSYLSSGMVGCLHQVSASSVMAPPPMSSSLPLLRQLGLGGGYSRTPNSWAIWVSPTTRLDDDYPQVGDSDQELGEQVLISSGNGVPDLFQ
eukprot:5372310-Amphidinium_carterae.2